MTASCWPQIWRLLKVEMYASVCCFTHRRIAIGPGSFILAPRGMSKADIQEIIIRARAVANTANQR